MMYGDVTVVRVRNLTHLDLPNHEPSIHSLGNQSSPIEIAANILEKIVKISEKYPISQLRYYMRIKLPQLGWYIEDTIIYDLTVGGR